MGGVATLIDKNRIPFYLKYHPRELEAYRTLKADIESQRSLKHSLNPAPIRHRTS